MSEILKKKWPTFLPFKFISEQSFKTQFDIWWQWLLGADKSLMTFECLTHAEMEFNAMLLCSRW